MKEIEIPTQRLYNQRISGNRFEKPEQVIDWLGAVQAQDYFGALWAVGMRMRRATDRLVEQAFQEGRILRTHFLRPTWHFVSPKDIRWMLALSAPRVHAVNASMYRMQEITVDVYKLGLKIMVNALRGGQQLTRDELGELFERGGISIDNGIRLAYLVMRAELDGIICSGPRRGKQFTYMLLDERVPEAGILSKDEVLAELASRYFKSRGPASIHDFAKWSGLSVAEARSGLEEVKGLLQHEVVDGQTYWFHGSKPFKKDKSPTVYLLSVYDEYISGYKDRSAIDAGFAPQLFARGNSLQFIIVLDGRITGAFRRTVKKDGVLIETNNFKRLSSSEKHAVATAADRYGKFLGLHAALV